MLDTSNATKIGKDIFLYKNFLNSDEANYLFNIAINLDNDRWISHNGFHYTSNSVPEIDFAIQKIKPLVSGEIVLDNSCYFQKYIKGQGMGIHQDNNKVLNDIEKSKSYKNGDPYTIVRQPIYGIVLYLNSVNGGDIYYPDQGISYSPQPGDLVIHSAEEHCKHGVMPTESDIRLCIPTYIYKEIKVPV